MDDQKPLPQNEPRKPEKTWRDHYAIGVKIFLILLGAALLFTALDAPCILLASQGVRCS